MILAEGLGKDFREGFLMRRKTALGVVSFEVRPGECIGFLGPNGAGKSTTLHLMLGFLRPTRGRVLLDRRPPRDPASRQRVGFLPEVFAFDRFASIRSLLRRFDAMSGRGAEGRDERVARTLAAVGLEDIPARRVGALSKGLTQRVGLAQAILGDPELLVLDEPMSGMDPASRRMVKQVLQERRRAGRTTLFSSHILADVEEVVDRALVLDRGTLLAELPVHELARRPGQTTITFSDPAPERFDAFLSQRQLARGAGGPLHTVAVADSALKNEVLAELALHGADIVSVQPRQTTLEQAFLALTGRGDSAP
ncbi:MAG: ABC transporter ATP-binding protein [Acidobacteria bacterium]|nr:ABC transporter ATP-binding protein [Acidobacteriota bacterium]